MNEKLFVNINGVKQGMILQGENTENPVLLYLHGGPGSPEVAFQEKYPTGLSKLFTVCWWDQRGSGLSYRNGISSNEMTMDQLISDTIEVAKYLIKQFGKEKIYIMGHSWGTLLGMLTVKKHPELFHAYIGVGQLSNQEKSERLAYSYMIEEFTKLQDKKMLRLLKKYPIATDGNISTKYLVDIRSKGLNKLGTGLIRNMKSMMEFTMPIVTYKGYSLLEKIHFLKGSLFSTKYLTDDLLYTDLMKEVLSVKIPVYIMHGKYDYIASYQLTKEYFMSLEAQQKGFYTFENSAHCPIFEEPEKMCQILSTDVLQNRMSLAD